MKNIEIKEGTILYANTGVAVKVLAYSPKFGGRVLIERADGLKGRKPMWRPLEKFSEKNPMDKKAKGGKVDEKTINELWKGYASAILFAENDSDTEEPLENNYSITDFDKQTVKSSKELLQKFYTENKKAIIESGLELFTIGSNIWYTRAGHGVGFFDHNLDLDIEKKLTKGAKALEEYPNVETYDGKVSVRGGGRVFSKGGKTESKQNEVYIEYFNKDKKHSLDKKYFKTYQDAVEWARKNFDKFDPDMIKYIYGKGANVGDNFIDLLKDMAARHNGTVNYVIKKKSGSSSLQFNFPTPEDNAAFQKELDEMKDSTINFGKGGDVPKSFEYSIGGL